MGTAEGEQRTEGMGVGGAKDEKRTQNINNSKDRFFLRLNNDRNLAE